MLEGIKLAILRHRCQVNTALYLVGKEMGGTRVKDDTCHHIQVKEDEGFKYSSFASGSIHSVFLAEGTRSTNHPYHMADSGSIGMDAVLLRRIATFLRLVFKARPFCVLCHLVWCMLSCLIPPPPYTDLFRMMKEHNRNGSNPSLLPPTTNPAKYPFFLTTHMESR